MEKSNIMFQPSICPHPSFPSFLVVAELFIQLLRDSDRLLSLATVSDWPASKVGKRFVFLGLATCRSCMKSLKETALISSIPRGSRIFLLLTFLLLVLLSNQKKRRKKEKKRYEGRRGGCEWSPGKGNSTYFSCSRVGKQERKEERKKNSFCWSEVVEERGCGLCCQTPHCSGLSRWPRM